MSMLLGGILGLVAALQGGPPGPPGAGDDSPPTSRSPTAPSSLTVLLVLLIVGCARTPAQTAERQRCLAKAELRANERSDAECLRPGVESAPYRDCLAAATTEPEREACDAAVWDTCPARSDIMSELEASQKECR